MILFILFPTADSAFKNLERKRYIVLTLCIFFLSLFLSTPQSFYLYCFVCVYFSHRIISLCLSIHLSHHNLLSWFSIYWGRMQILYINYYYHFLNNLLRMRQQQQILQKEKKTTKEKEKKKKYRCGYLIHLMRTTSNIIFTLQYNSFQHQLKKKRLCAISTTNFAQTI